MSNVPDEVREAMERAMWVRFTQDHHEPESFLTWDELPDHVRDMERIRTDAALSALEAAGWVCVPKVPTQQMLEAAASVWKEGYSIGYRHPITRGFSPALGGPSSAEIYAAMLTASRKEKPDV